VRHTWRSAAALRCRLFTSFHAVPSVREAAARSSSARGGAVRRRSATAAPVAESRAWLPMKTLHFTNAYRDVGRHPTFYEALLRDAEPHGRTCGWSFRVRGSRKT
jgi:hypothetical protein